MTNATDTALSLECSKEPYALRLLKANWFLLLLFVASFIAEGVYNAAFPSAAIVIMFVVGLAASMFVSGSFSEANYSLVKLTANSSDLYLEYFSGNQLKELTLAWTEINILINYHKVLWYRTLVTEQNRPVLTILKNNDTVFQLYAGTNKELDSEELVKLIDELKSMQQKALNNKEDLTS